MNLNTLAAEKVSFVYRDSPLSRATQASTLGRSKILDQFSLEVRAGSFVTLLGPNGSGKSTLLKLMSGILKLESESGKIFFEGEDFTVQPPSARARKVAYVGYDFKVDFPITAYEAVLLGRTAAGSGFAQHLSAADREITETSMKKCLCWDWRDRNIQTLSGGERQLVALARALAQGAKVLLLDESLSQMDLHHQSQMGKMLRELTLNQGWSVVLVSHDINLAVELADQAVLMKGGQKIAEGPVEKVITEANLKILYPGAELAVGPNPVTGTPKVFLTSSKIRSSQN